MPVKPQIIIAAISSRAYVQAAVDAGFEVIALDTFGDADTQRLALQTFKVDTLNGNFHTQAFNAVLAQIDCSHVIGICIGAGFEAIPELLAKIASTVIRPLYNAFNVIHSVKDPTIFFEFLSRIGASHPATQLMRPSNTNGWLKKQIGGSGGAHIKPALPLNFVENIPVYYQRICAGVPHGCLFLADGNHAQVVGVHQQWCAPTTTQPYRFGGAVSHAEIAEDIAIKIDFYVQEITRHFGLRGLNSLDFILHGNAIYLLEINPRLSASLQLYSAKKGNLFAAHVQACLGKLKHWPIVEKQARAMQVVYANKTAYVPMAMDWPDWVVDVPQPSSEIAAGAPICTVLAEARSAKMARKKLMQRVALL